MPTIPTYTARNMPQSVPDFGRQTAEVYGGGKGLIEAGRAIGEVTQDARERVLTKEETDQAAEVNEWASKARLGWMDRLQQMQDAAPADAAGFGKQVLDEYNKFSETELNQPGLTEFKKKRMEEMSTQIGENVAAHALAFESKARVEYRMTAIGDSLNRLSNVAARDPTQYDEIYQQGLETIRQSGLGAQYTMKLEQAWKNDAVKAMLMGQIERNPSAVISNLDKGKYDDRLDAGARAAIYNSAQAAQRQRAAEARANNVVGLQAIKLAETRLESGYSLPAEEEAMIDQAVKSSGSAQAAAYWGQLKQNKNVLAKASTLSPRELDSFINEQVAPALQKDGTSANEFNLFKSLNTLRSTMQTQLQQDPLTWAASRGVVELPALDFTSPQAISASMAARAQVATKVASQYETPIKLLTEGEAASLNTQMLGADPAQQMALASAIRGSMTPEQATSFYKQIGEKQPALGYVMAMPDDMNTGRLAAIRGFNVLKQYPDIIPNSAFEPQLTSTMGTAISLLKPEVQKQMTDTVRAVTAEKINRLGQFDSNMVTEAVRQVVGDIGRVNGAQVVLPPKVDDNEMVRAFINMNEQDLVDLSASNQPPVDDRGRPLPAEDLRSYRPRTVGVGAYAFFQEEDAALYDAEGNPYIMQLDAEAVKKINARRGTFIERGTEPLSIGRSFSFGVN